MQPGHGSEPLQRWPVRLEAERGSGSKQRPTSQVTAGWVRVPPFSQSAPTTCLFASRSDRRRLRLRPPTADLDSKPPSRQRAVSSARSPLAIGTTLLLPTDPIASDFYVCLTRTRRNMGLVRKSQVSRPLPLPLFLCVSLVAVAAAFENCWRRQPGVAELPSSAVCRCDHANQTQALTRLAIQML